MTISTITISGIDYTSYASVAQADEHLAVDPTRSAAWVALTADTKGTYLVAATRRLGLLNWVGEKAGAYSAQPDAFPRTGLTYADGAAVTTSDVPYEVEVSTSLLAGSIALDATNANAGTSGSNIKRLAAGSAQIEYFRATTGTALQDETAFALIRQWLQGYGVSDSVGPTRYGACEKSEFTDLQGGYGLSEGYN